jgi:hypothetical protein
MARTTDGGASWEAARVIFDPGPQSQTIGNQIVVLPNGTLVNFFTQLDPGPNNTQVATIRLIRSTDRGGSWSAPVTVAGVTALGARDPLDDGGVLLQLDNGPGQSLVLGLEGPHLADQRVDLAAQPPEGQDPVVAEDGHHGQDEKGADHDPAGTREPRHRA